MVRPGGTPENVRDPPVSTPSLERLHPTQFEAPDASRDDIRGQRLASDEVGEDADGPSPVPLVLGRGHCPASAGQIQRQPGPGLDSPLAGEPTCGPQMGRPGGSASPAEEGSPLAQKRADSADAGHEPERGKASADSNPVSFTQSRIKSRISTDCVAITRSADGCIVSSRISGRFMVRPAPAPADGLVRSARSGESGRGNARSWREIRAVHSVNAESLL